MDVLEILRRRDVEAARAALAEVHRQKAFALADAEYFKHELKTAARLHAHHIALSSLLLPEAEVDEESITGLDYKLAKRFREHAEKCAALPPVEDDFFKDVVDELNDLIRRLCAEVSV